MASTKIKGNSFSQYRAYKRLTGTPNSYFVYSKSQNATVDFISPRYPYINDLRSAGIYSSIYIDGKNLVRDRIKIVKIDESKPASDCTINVIESTPEGAETNSVQISCNQSLSAKSSTSNLKLIESTSGRTLISESEFDSYRFMSNVKVEWNASHHYTFCHPSEYLVGDVGSNDKLFIDGAEAYQISTNNYYTTCHVVNLTGRSKNTAYRMERQSSTSPKIEVGWFRIDEATPVTKAVVGLTAPKVFYTGSTSAQEVVRINGFTCVPETYGSLPEASTRPDLNPKRLDVSNACSRCRT